VTRERGWGPASIKKRMTTAHLDAAEPTLVARERLALAAGAAILAAGVILVLAVLPAEFGIDPTGIGKKLGLTAMSDTARSLAAFTASRGAAAAGVPTVVAQQRSYQQETIALEIAPHDSVEYKYRLDKGEALLYSWKATGLVNYELHAEPDGAPRGYAESFEKKEARDTASGTLTAPFSGIHGWYWENTSNQPVTVTLSAAGFFNMSHEFRKGQAPRTKTF
jgi:hypothetical protein